ncbi:MAG: hypothetical protein AAF628_03960 [Planctomycetota bacterium]
MAGDEAAHAVNRQRVGLLVLLVALAGCDPLPPSAVSPTAVEHLAEDLQSAFAPLRGGIERLATRQNEDRERVGELAQQVGAALQALQQQPSPPPNDDISALRARLEALEQQVNEQREASDRDRELMIHALDSMSSRLQRFLERLSGQPLPVPAPITNGAGTGPTTDSVSTDSVGTNGAATDGATRDANPTATPSDDAGGDAPDQQQAASPTPWWWACLAAAGGIGLAFLVARGRRREEERVEQATVEPRLADGEHEPFDLDTFASLRALATAAGELTDRPIAVDPPLPPEPHGAAAPIACVYEIEHPEPAALRRLVTQWLTEDPRILCSPPPSTVTEDHVLSVRYFLPPEEIGREAPRIEAALQALAQSPLDQPLDRPLVGDGKRGQRAGGDDYSSAVSHP